MARLKTGTRTVKNRAGSFNIIGLFWSPLMRRHVVFESLGEQMLFLQLEYLKRRYREQPHRFELFFEGERRAYYPDVESTDPATGEVVLYQVKPLDKAEAPNFQDLMNSYEPQLASMGYRHEVFIPEQLSETYWLNLKTLYGYAKRHSSTEAVDVVSPVLATKGSWHLGDAVRALRAEQVHVGLLYTCMFERAVTFDVERPITKKTFLECAFQR